MMKVDVRRAVVYSIFMILPYSIFTNFPRKMQNSTAVTMNEEGKIA